MVREVLVQLVSKMHRFELDKQLERDCVFIKDLDLSRLLLFNDSNYPWLILVPKLRNKIEFFELSTKEQQILSQEIHDLSLLLKQLYKADKINIATLGNQVKQLHIHIIARFKNDPAWPNPVWNAVDKKPYTDSQIAKIIRNFK